MRKVVMSFVNWWHTVVRIRLPLPFRKTVSWLCNRVTLGRHESEFRRCPLVNWIACSKRVQRSLYTAASLSRAVNAIPFLSYVISVGCFHSQHNIKLRNRLDGSVDAVVWRRIVRFLHPVVWSKDFFQFRPVFVWNLCMFYFCNARLYYICTYSSSLTK